MYMCHSLESASSEIVMDRGVQAISFSEDGGRIYVLSKNGMNVYEASSGRFLTGNTAINKANAFAMSPKGTAILTQRKDKYEVYNSNLEHQCTFERPGGNQTFFRYIDDDRVLFVSKQGKVEVWNLSGGNRTFETASVLTKCCDTFSLKKNGMTYFRLLCCDRRGVLELLDSFKGRTYTNTIPESEITTCCKFSPNGASVTTGHINGTLRIWDGHKLELKGTVNGGDVPVKDCAYLIPDLGDIIVSLHESGVLKVWNTFRRRQYELGFMNFDGKVCALETSPVNPQVCVALENKTVILNVHLRR